MTLSNQFDPLDYNNLGQSVMSALLKQQPVPLGSLQSTVGAGVYAIYYIGSFKHYERLAAINREGKFRVPIYVGKAIPAGARQGGRGNDLGYPLFHRLKQHSDSISQATSTLNLNDFYCRYLVVTDVWIPMTESMLIENFRPLWNAVVPGFGNHHPGGKRTSGERPMWDTLHPGRLWASAMPANRYSEDQIISRISEALENDLPRFLNLA